MAKIHIDQAECIPQIEALSGDITELKIHGRYALIPQEFFDRMTRFTCLKSLVLCGNLRPLYTAIDLKFLKSLTLLEELSISNLAVKTIDSLSHCPLKSLALNGTFMDSGGKYLPTSLEFLEYCPLLENLCITDAKIAPPNNERFQLSPLRHTPHLTTLSLCYCKLKGLDGIENCPGLVNLALNNNCFGEVEQLINCPCLESLKLDDNPIVSFNGVEFCQRLKRIQISSICYASLLPFDLVSSLKTIRVIPLSRHWRDFVSSSRISEQVNDELRFFVAKGVNVCDVMDRKLNL